jgi:imidazoleglycerol-phosphate dehydratase
MSAPRQSVIQRSTRETRIALALILDGQGSSKLSSPVPFLNHMLDAFARHGVFDLELDASGDVEVDPHHLVEDIGLALGDAFKSALGDHKGICRYGWATLPMDETLVSCALDFGGRPSFIWKVKGLERRKVGDFDCELTHEFFAAFATRAACNLHFVLHHGKNAHHIIEACFKAFAKAADAATRIDPRLGGAVPSTKGTLNS